jgi:BASS family bile acid:Na+ symporter
MDNIGRLALVTVVFCQLSLAIGFLVPRLFRVEPRQAVASSFEIGIHNATLAIVIAQTVIGSVEMSLPGAVYGVLMFFVALGWGFLIRRLVPVTADADADPAPDAEVAQRG